MIMRSTLNSSLPHTKQLVWRIAENLQDSSTIKKQSPSMDVFPQVSAKQNGYIVYYKCTDIGQVGMVK